MGQALGYMTESVGPADGVHRAIAQVPIHNNASEAALRIIALARKNSLFFGNDEAGKRFAVLYSLIATCEKHGVNPVEYLTDVLIRIQDQPMSRIAELLPDRWKVTFGKSAAEAAPRPSAGAN